MQEAAFCTIVLQLLHIFLEENLHLFLRFWSYCQRCTAEFELYSRLACTYYLKDAGIQETEHCVEEHDIHLQHDESSNRYIFCLALPKHRLFG